MKLEKLMEEMQKDFELNKPIPQISMGVYRVEVEEGVSIVISQNISGILFNANVVDAPVGKEEELYLELLNANLFGQGTYNATLSLSDDARKLTLSRLIEYDIDYKDFQEIFDDFVNAIDFWRDEALAYQQ